MANIVELRGKNGDELREKLDNAYDEMFNLRFLKASARLEDVSRIKVVRREIAQLKTVLNMRQLAKETAASEPAIADVLAGKIWQATARFNYEESAWLVTFRDEDGDELASAVVDLNRKQPKGRRAREVQGPTNMVLDYETTG